MSRSCSGARVAVGLGITVRSPSPTYSRPDAGFSLVEVMIATALLATSLAALAQLFALAVRNNATARNDTFAAALAAQKVEQLRGDSRLASPAAGNTLQVSADGYVDYLDANGAVVADRGTIIPDGTAYIRRWSIEPLPAGSAVVLQVLVTRRRERGLADTGAVARAPEEARVIAVARLRP